MKKFKLASLIIINAPLDGGILSLLAIAGVSYFVIRRKKK
jgi:hypothetical protein